jgi:hypothetical protein
VQGLSFRNATDLQIAYGLTSIVDLATPGTIDAGFYVTSTAAGLIQNDVVLMMGDCTYPFVATNCLSGDHQ